MASPAPPMPSTRKHILAGDDSPVILDLYREILEDEGYRVSLSETPLDLDDVRRIRPDLVILDHMLDEGEGSGWQLLRELREDADLASLPVVVCTGAVQEVREAGERLARAQVEVLFKPFEIDALLACIARASQTAARHTPQGPNQPLTG